MKIEDLVNLDMGEAIEWLIENKDDYDLVEKNPINNFENKLIEVCDQCLQASCWHGNFMCSDSRNAGTIKKTVSELRLLKKEHEDNWSDDTLNKIYGEYAPHGYKSI